MFKEVKGSAFYMDMFELSLNLSIPKKQNYNNWMSKSGGEWMRFYVN